MIQQAQIQQPPHFGYDTEVAHTLSSAGWVYLPEADRWKKGQHGITVEGLHELLFSFHGLRGRLLRAIRKGAVGFTFDLTQAVEPSGVDIDFTIRIEWPDAVTRLGAVADA